jgi:hypothetical protein
VHQVIGVVGVPGGVDATARARFGNELGKLALASLQKIELAPVDASIGYLTVLVTATTECPSASNRRTTALPIKPVAPVTTKRLTRREAPEWQ